MKSKELLISEYGIEDWDILSDENIEDIRRLDKERYRTFNDPSLSVMDRYDLPEQYKDSIDKILKEAKNNPQEQIPDFVKERRAKKNGQSLPIVENTNEPNKISSIDENQVTHRLSILENRIDYLIQLVKNLSIDENNKTEVKTELTIVEDNNTEDKSSSIDVNFIDYLSVEERPKAINLSPTNRKQRNMYCPKCLEYIGQGSMYAHKKTIENHKCKA